MAFKSGNQAGLRVNPAGPEVGSVEERRSEETPGPAAVSCGRLNISDTPFPSALFESLPVEAAVRLSEILQFQILHWTVLLTNRAPNTELNVQIRKGAWVLKSNGFIFLPDWAPGRWPELGVAASAPQDDLKEAPTQAACRVEPTRKI